MKEVVGVGQGATMSTWKKVGLLMACSNEAVTIVSQNKNERGSSRGVVARSSNVNMEDWVVTCHH